MTAEQRAARLLRWYPSEWRERYGEEFADLLACDISDRSSDWRRTIDVARSGCVARLAVMGLADGPSATPQSSMGAVGAAAAAFAVAGLSLWSQVVVGATAERPTTASSAAHVLLTATGVALAVIAVLATVPVLSGLFGVVRRRGSALLLPVSWCAVALVELVGGAAHFARQPELVGRGASLGRAATLSISTYWLHPHDLLAQTAPVLMWMVASPICLWMLLSNGARLVRAAALSDRALRYESWLAKTAVIGMVPALISAAWWVIGSQSQPGTPLQAGSLDVVLIGVMSAAVVTVGRASRRIAPYGG